MAQAEAPLGGDSLELVVYAQHGRELMGLKSPVCEPLIAIERRENTR